MLAGLLGLFAAGAVTVLASLLLMALCVATIGAFTRGLINAVKSLFN